MLKVFYNRKNQSSSQSKGSIKMFTSCSSASAVMSHNNLNRPKSSGVKLGEASRRSSSSSSLLKRNDSYLATIIRKLSRTSSSNEKDKERAERLINEDDSSSPAKTTGSLSSASTTTTTAIVGATVSDNMVAKPKSSRKSIVSSRSEINMNEIENIVNKELGEEAATVVLNIAKRYTPVNNVDVSELTDFSSKFCGENVPSVSLAVYISRLVRNFNHAFYIKGNPLDSVGVRCLLLAVIYIERFMKARPEFQLHELNVHRMFFVAMTEALKVGEDSYPDNKYMAVVGGVDTPQLNALEIAFCLGVDFRFVVSGPELDEMYKTFQTKPNKQVANINVSPSV